MGLAVSRAIRSQMTLEIGTAFRRRYFFELDRHPDAKAQLRAVIRKVPVTLANDARDKEDNDAITFVEYVESHEYASSSRVARL